MTLIIGFKCEDGIVVGADGAATFAPPLGPPTIVQPVAKLEVVQGKIIIAVSGPVGFGQLFKERIDKLWGVDRAFGRGVNREGAMRILRDAWWEDLRPAYAAASAAQPVLGNFASRSVITETLVALPVGERPELIRLDHQATPEASTQDFPHVAIGSGQPLADPFLAFLRRIFWPNSLPRVVDGIFAVTWAVRHAIQVTPGGVSEPLQLAVLERSRGEFRARSLEKEELGEHRQHVVAIEEYLSKYWQSQQPGPEPPVAPKGS